MSEKRAEQLNRLEQYLDGAELSERSHIRKDGEVIWIPEVYCHNGHSMMVDSEAFDGHRAVHLHVHTSGTGELHTDLFLSPIFNDARKEGPELPEETAFKLMCPVCHEELRQLVPCTCRPGAYRRAVYLTPDPDELGAVGICEMYGCPQSFVTEDGELLYEVVVEKTR